MFNKISIRWRLTIMSILLLTMCCLGLTLTLNFAADKMVNTIDATALTPANISNKIEEEIDMQAITYESIPIAKESFRIESIVYMILIILGGGALTYYISGKALTPLSVLDNEVKSMTIHNLSKSLTVPNTNDEIADLTRSFNEMTKKLEDAFMMQKRFSANAAHELRTPLTVLQTKIDVFKKNPHPTTEEYNLLMELMEKQIRKLRDLVKSLLEMTNKNAENEQSDIFLVDLLEDIVRELSPIAKDKDVKVTLKSDDSVVKGNIDLLYRAFYNLIENGINYNKKGGSVNISVKKIKEDKVEIEIQDTGVGISEEAKKHIFEPFYRVDTSRSRENGGAGIGLSIVEHIITEHKGTILVIDRKEGGTCFRVMLG